jgi:hypothetical protein
LLQALIEINHFVPTEKLGRCENYLSPRKSEAKASVPYSAHVDSKKPLKTGWISQKNGKMVFGLSKIDRLSFQKKSNFDEF